MKAFFVTSVGLGSDKKNPPSPDLERRKKRTLPAMLPIEPRLKPLGATIIHYADETKGKFTRCHSFSGYVPYFLAENVSHESERNECEHPELCRSNCSSANVETDVGEASPVPHVWPDTDEEGCDERSGPELRGPGRASAASSESGDSEEFKSRLNSHLRFGLEQYFWRDLLVSMCMYMYTHAHIFLHIFCMCLKIRHQNFSRIVSCVFFLLQFFFSQTSSDLFVRCHGKQGFTKLKTPSPT